MKSKFFIDRPILSIVLAVVILLLGFLGYLGLSVEQFPDIAPPVVEISADYPGASAEAVQKSVIVPIEEAVNGVDGIDEILSSSTSNGNASISVTFKSGIDPDIATVMVKNRLDEVEGIMPKEVLETGIQVEKEQRSFLRLLALESPDDRYDNDFITNYFDINLSPRLQRIKGVGNVELLGSVYAIRIWLDPRKMAFYGLEPKDIEEVLEAQNIEAAIGTIGEDSKNTFQYTLVYRGRLRDAEEFGDIVLRSESDGDDLRLRDVARCELGREDYAYDSWVNSHHGVVVILNQANGSNAQQVNHEIDRLLEEAKPHLPPGLEFRTILDTNDFLDASMRGVYITLFEAIVLVILVVLLFLQNAKVTLIPAIAIIVSLVGTFAFMYVAGFTLNLITLFALVLVIGTVVDDAIVVVEAVQSQFDGGERNPYEATVKAMGKISKAVITTTIVFMFVFIPISFVSGLVGTYYRQFGLTMAVAVAISTLNALTLSPALCVLLMKPKTSQGQESRFYKAFNAAYGALTEKYKESPAMLIAHRRLTVGATVVMFILLVILARSVPTGLIPDEDTGNVFVDITTPAGSTLEQTKKAVMQATEKVKNIDEIEHCASIAGWNILNNDGANTGMLMIKLKHWDERSGSDHEIDAVTRQIEARMDSIKSAHMFTFAMPTVTGYGYSNSIELYVQDYGGSTIDRLKKVTDDFTEALSQREEIGEAYCSYEVNFPQYTVSVNAAICKRYGVEPSAVLGVLNGYIGSNYATQFNAFGRLYHVVMQADPALRDNKDDLNNIFVTAEEGEYIPVGELVSIKKSYGVQSLNRFNLYSAINVEVSPEDGYSTGEAMKAIEEVSSKVLPQGYGYEYSGTAQEEIKTAKNRSWVLLLVIVFIYIVLAALFESALIPLAVLLSVPFGLFGSYLFALLFQIENNIYMQVGIIMLIGLLSKTAILLTEYASERRHEGMGIRESALTAARERLRPVLMTVMTLVIGLLPMVFSTGALAVGSRSLGICIIGGMLVGTAAILLFVPLFFMYFQYLQERIMARRVSNNAAILILILFTSHFSLFTSCKTYSNYQSQQIETDSLLRPEYRADGLWGQAPDPSGWREFFTDPQLVGLIEEGLAHNSILNIAKLQIDIAKAALRHAKGELFPSLELGVDGETSRFKNSEDDALTESKFNFGAEANWQIDIFGRLQNAKKAAAATVEEKKAYVQAVQVELIATIATCYYQLEMYDAQIADTRTILNSWEESIQAQKALMHFGEATSDEVSQAEASRLAAETTLEELQLQMVQTENALCTLIGRPSGYIERGDFSQGDNMNLSGLKSVPLTAITTRPDVRQAEANLKRAFYVTNEARAALYPSLNLSGRIGWTNDADEVVSPAGLLTKALASLAQPIFANGRLKAAVKQAQAEQEEAKITFRQTILEAGQEVNDALASQQYAQRAIALRQQQVEKLNQVLAATEKRMHYDSEVNYLQVLLARQSLLEARLSLLSDRYIFIESAIHLYRALGGGNLKADL